METVDFRMTRRWLPGLSPPFWGVQGAALPTPQPCVSGGFQSWFPKGPWRQQWAGRVTSSNAPQMPDPEGFSGGGLETSSDIGLNSPEGQPLSLEYQQGLFL